MIVTNDIAQGEVILDGAFVTERQRLDLTPSNPWVWVAEVQPVLCGKPVVARRSSFPHPTVPTNWPYYYKPKLITIPDHVERKVDSNE